MVVGSVDAQGNIIDGIGGLAEAIFGHDGDDRISAGFGDDDGYGGNGNAFVRAGAGNDLLEGGVGNDVHDGQAGADRMVGGSGTDVFCIGEAGDVVVEAAGQGHDKVISKLSHVLGAAFEEVWRKEGSGATLGSGNALANKIIGNANSRSGLGGVDQPLGMDGDDALVGGTGNDILGGGAGVGVFVFASGEGRDQVKGIELGCDALVVEGVATLALHLTVLADRAVLSWGTTDRIVISETVGAGEITLESVGLLPHAWV